MTTMPRIRIHNFTVSLDAYAAGPHQSRDEPLGVGGRSLHDWAFATRTFRDTFGMQGGATGVDDRFAAEGELGIGASIMGRNMFGPIRGPWNDELWTGWWGVDPPFHHPVLVLTHHARDSIVMQGGTTFHFVTDGIHAALEQASEAAGGKDVRIAGGAATIRQYLSAGLVDEAHVVIAPILLGSGERPFPDADLPIGYECTELVSSESVAHVRLRRRRSDDA
jgi:dihydrofolate reductase